MLRILYFAQLRELLGRTQEELSLGSSVRDVQGLLMYLRSRGALWEQCLADEARVRVAVNRRMASDATTIGEGDEVALFPPVTGG